MIGLDLDRKLGAGRNLDNFDEILRNLRSRLRGLILLILFRAVARLLTLLRPPAPPFTLIFFFSFFRFSICGGDRKFSSRLKMIHGSFIPNVSNCYIFEYWFIDKFFFWLDFRQLSPSIAFWNRYTIILLFAFRIDKL